MSHGSSTTDAVSPRSRLYQGPYGRLFDQLEPWRPTREDGSVISDESEVARFCAEVANRLMTESTVADGSATVPSQVDEVTTSAAFSSTIPAGYTYFGQFIDHDITFDPASSLQRQNDPNRLANFRTPRLDLDNLYGRGRDDQPYLFDGSGKFLVASIEGTTLEDLPRNDLGRAIIGDPRNDENAIVSQLQLAFLKAHNTLVDRATELGHADPFSSARTTLRWLYQWVVWHDFLGKVIDPAIRDRAMALEEVDGRTTWVRGLKDVYTWSDQPFMPVEFSVAAYRFGHSMVRNRYRTNAKRGADASQAAPIFDNATGTAGDDLRGFRPVSALNAVEWDWFLQMTSSVGDFPQMAHRIDTKLANSLTFLHEGPAGSPNNILAARNLRRGIQFELPSGTAVARALGFTPMALAEGEPDALWFYLLKEAETVAGGTRLGPVGSTILAAVFSGLLAGDPQSWVTVDPRWRPEADPLLHNGADNIDSVGEWNLSALIRIAGVPTAAAEF